MGIGIGTNCPENFTRLGPPRAIGIAVTAIVAQHGIHIGDKLILQSPLRPDHFLPGEWTAVLGQGTYHGTGSALVAFLQGITTGAFQILYKTQIRIYIHCHSSASCLLSRSPMIYLSLRR